MNDWNRDFEFVAMGVPVQVVVAVPVVVIVTFDVNAIELECRKDVCSDFFRHNFYGEFYVCVGFQA